MRVMFLLCSFPFHGLSGCRRFVRLVPVLAFVGKRGLIISCL